MHPLQARREAKGWSKAELGRRSGCSGQMIGQIERNEVKAGTLLAVRISAALESPLRELFPELAPVLAALHEELSGTSESSQA